MKWFNIWVLQPTKGGLCRRYAGPVQARNEAAAIKMVAEALNIEADTIVARIPESDDWWRPINLGDRK